MNFQYPKFGRGSVKRPVAFPRRPVRTHGEIRLRLTDGDLAGQAKPGGGRSGTIAINRGMKEKNIAVRIDPECAQPGPFAHKVAMAVIRKQSSYGRPAQKQISFSQRELMRLSDGRALHLLGPHPAEPSSPIFERACLRIFAAMLDCDTRAITE
jgi:hypothetical protein